MKKITVRNKQTQAFIKTVYKNNKGQFHRTDGPAIERANGDKEWWFNGKPHRVDGPTVEMVNGYKCWYRMGRLHREDGPAIEWANGDKSWYQNDQPHRTDGPAVEYISGHKEWSIFGRNFSEANYKLEIQKMFPPMKKFLFAIGWLAFSPTVDGEDTKINYLDDLENQWDKENPNVLAVVIEAETREIAKAFAHAKAFEMEFTPTDSISVFFEIEQGSNLIVPGFIKVIKAQ